MIKYMFIMGPKYQENLGAMREAIVISRYINLS